MARKQEVKLNKYAWTGIIITLAALICIIVLAIPTKKERFYNTYSALNTELEEDHVFREVSFKKMKKVVKNKSDDEYVYVILGGETSDSFYSELHNVDQIAKEKGIERVYYLNSDKFEEEDFEDLSSYLREVADRDKVKTSNISSSKVRVYPDVYVFRDGKLVDRLYDVSLGTTTSAGSLSVTRILQNYILRQV